MTLPLHTPRSEKALETSPTAPSLTSLSIHFLGPLSYLWLIPISQSLTPPYGSVLKYQFEQVSYNNQHGFVIEGRRVFSFVPQAPSSCPSPGNGHCQ